MGEDWVEFLNKTDGCLDASWGRGMMSVACGARALFAMGRGMIAAPPLRLLRTAPEKNTSICFCNSWNRGHIPVVHGDQL